ncbi:PucR family transcriptional regulator [Paeniglutamicibacter psychrophenolicus]|uniref:PucR family transcriptional regulator n=1 Tax=Paeniglutamicibacter psychrophenolicus TaxID=257454 RepID=A0ABS4WJR6_9MICC|nr:hypothetical protein [Paeniglutamicibacter psychrophenolicus]
MKFHNAPLLGPSGEVCHTISRWNTALSNPAFKRKEGMAVGTKLWGDTQMNMVSRHQLLGAIADNVTEISREITKTTVGTIPAYAGFEGELQGTISIVIDTFLQHAQGTRKDLNPELIANARRRAHQGFDGGAMTQSWRVVNRGMWNWLTTQCPVDFDARGDGLVLWNDFLDLSERYVGAVTDAFFEAQSELKAGELVSRRSAMDALLEGRSPDQTSKTLHALGIRSDRIFLAACSFTGQNPANLAESPFVLEPVLRDLQAHRRRLPWTVFRGMLIVCLPDDMHSRESLKQLPDRLSQAMNVGISRPSPATFSLDTPLRQATLALLGAGGAERVVDFDSLSLVQIAALQADLQPGDVPPKIEAFLAQDVKMNHEWVETARALTKSQGNVAQAAQKLHVHTNTIYYRIAAVREFCDLDLRSLNLLADIQFLLACKDFGTYH